MAKEEITFDYPAWKAKQKLNTYRVTTKNGELIRLRSHEPVVGDPTPTLKFAKYTMTTVEAKKETGGAKNKKIEIIEEETATVSLSAGFHAGEWVSFVDESDMIEVVTDWGETVGSSFAAITSVKSTEKGE